MSAAMSQQCKYYKQYKGIHKPRCSGGIGCIECWKKYAGLVIFNEMK